MVNYSTIFFFYYIVCISTPDFLGVILYGKASWQIGGCPGINAIKKAFHKHLVIKPPCLQFALIQKENGSRIIS